ncbi:MAG: CoA transferase [Chloroflexi bacterium]|nr:CoA transferase [Chloroflexota bacterium]
MPIGLLEGIRVLDLGTEVSGPFCSKLLADYGAEVIKVEPPSDGDPARRMGPFAGDDPHPEKSIPFLYLNTNKRGITLDIRNRSGKIILAGLLRNADVLVHNLPPAEAESLGLHVDTLFQHNRGMVVTSISAFGQTGPYRDFSATDIVCCAFSGLMYHSGDSDREPLRNALSQSLYVAGVNAAVATLAALFHRLTTGRGQQVDVSVIECMASHLVQPVPYYNFMGAIKGRRPIRGSGFEELMPARDGYVVPSVQGSQPWSTVADLIGAQELQDPRFASGPGRIEHGEDLKQLLIEGLAHWDRKPLFQASGERRLVFGMAQDAGDLFDCSHLRERGFFVEVEHPVAGRAEYPGMGAKLSEGTFEVHRPAPLLGQHNTEIYCNELGYTANELVGLRASGVI